MTLSFVFSYIVAICSVNANSLDCYYYVTQAKYYQDQILEAKNFCKIADYAELTVNYLGSAKKTCKSSMEPAINSSLAQMSEILLKATIKCGH